MIAKDVLDAMEPLVDALAKLKVPYHVGGSVASSTYGTARATLDVDIVADLHLEHVGSLVRQLQDVYYIDDQMIREAIREHSSFNLIHLPTMVKVDVFIPGEQAFDRLAFQRVHEETLAEAENTHPFYIASPEDVVLRKLQWYKAGGEISERQWLDVLGVLKVQQDAIDYAYLRQWAGQLGLAELLERAMEEANL